VASLLTIAACVWLSLLLVGKVENYLRRRLARDGNMGASSVIRFGRRVIELFAILTGLLVGLYHFGLNPAAVLAGLGVGGIAIALAAQKTLENVLGGISIIFDWVVRVGDLLKVGDTLGMIEDVGLRSTRIRTLDRSLVSVPNGQLANLTLENLSARDKFWFHPSVRLRYDTTAGQMQSIVEGLSNLLAQHPRIEPNSAYVRFRRFGTSSLELEVFAYVMTREWSHFLEIQGQLLLGCMEIVQAAGAQIGLQAPICVAPTSVPQNEQARVVTANEPQVHL
jgi:MscS family membrane protein